MHVINLPRDTCMVNDNQPLFTWRNNRIPERQNGVLQPASQDQIVCRGVSDLQSRRRRGTAPGGMPIAGVAVDLRGGSCGVAASIEVRTDSERHGRAADREIKHL